MQNPLLNFSELPHFESIEPSQVVPALQDVIQEAKELIDQLCLIEQPSWQNFVSKLEDSDERVGRVWSPVSHLNSVKNSDELRQAYQQGISLLTEFHSQVGHNLRLYGQYEKVAASDEFTQLTQAQQKVVTNALRDFRLSGAQLNDSDKEKLQTIDLELADLSNDFEKNVLDSTQEWALLIEDSKQLKGMPDSALAMAAQFAADADQTGWMLTLQIPSYLAVMQHVEDASIRKTVYTAYAKRASEFSESPEHNNGPIINKILERKARKAHLLGFQNYAEYSLETKMAESSAQVIDFLQELVDYAKPVAENELQQLKEFAKNNYQIENLNPWDISFYSERLREQQYAFSDEQVKAYFPAPVVFQGMFEIVEQLFSIRIQETNNLQTWQADVQSFEVIDIESDSKIGEFFSDIYVRKNKRGGAWMDTCLHRRVTHNSQGQTHIQLPVAYLTCNFSPPVGSDPALLSHDEVETLFHEFGHTLHHLLTQVDEMSVAGINAVAWDAVELPSQFLENWCWNEQSLQKIAQHYKTGEKLPKDLLDKMRAAKQFQSGMQTLRQVEFALFDMRLHCLELEQLQAETVRQQISQVRAEVAILETPDFNRFENNFSHIFAGGYAAGYYSYKWAELLSADAFGRFTEEGILNPQAGMDFRKAILERGGVQDANDLFIEFRGRPPTIKSLLVQSGFLSASQSQGSAA